MRITELPNPLTEDIDVQPLAGMLRQLAAVEAEMFGSPWGPGLGDERFLVELERLRACLTRLLAREPKASIVLAGAGSSGRLAVMAAATCGRPQVQALLAGGLDAFFRARENVEDDPDAGARALQAAVGAAPAFAYVGISCGLSAAWVAGQVDWAMRHGAAATAVIGFNPLDQALTRPLPGLAGHFRDILRRLQRSPGGFLLNPVLGPEAVTGSTRLKGGSATAIILDLLLHGGEPRLELDRYRRLHELFRARSAALEAAVAAAAAALRNGAAIIYLAGAREGLTALLDASECPPTFGADADQVRVCVDPDLERLLPGFSLSGHGAEAIVPPDGSALFTLASADSGAWLGRAREGLAGSATGDLALAFAAEVTDYIETLPPARRPVFRDLALKWTLNSLTTSAFIACGKVWGNRMIDVRISNLKLLERAIGLVAQVANIPPDRAEALIRATVAAKTGVAADDRALIAGAVTIPRLVPLVVVQARLRVGLERAEQLLTEQPVVRHHLAMG